MRNRLFGLLYGMLFVFLFVVRIPAESITSANIGLMIYVPSGQYQRDGNQANISRVGDFWMSRYEITREQFVSILGSDPSEASSSQGLNDPVQKVNWYHAIAFSNKLSLAEGLTPVYSVTVAGAPVDWNSLTYAQIPRSNNGDWNGAVADWEADGYRLPTEMEWMWAAMGAPADGRDGGTNTTGYRKSYAGDGGSGSADAYLWHKGNSRGSTHPVGEKQPNELDIYDLSGNVKEWCWDLYSETLPNGTLSDYRGPSSGSLRVNHGGSVALDARYASVASRNANHPYLMSNNTGLRLVRSVKDIIVSTPEKQSTVQSSSSGAMTYRVGDTGPAGGLIFFVDRDDRYPDFDYLEAAPDWSSADGKSGEGSGWFGPQRSISVGASARGLGEGDVNTASLVTAFSGDGDRFAANFCADLVINGYDDWYLPSIHELVLMRDVLFKNGLGGFRTSYYWSSTEYQANQAYFVDFKPNNTDTDRYAARSNGWFVRPVRKFGESTVGVTDSVPTSSTITAVPASARVETGTNTERKNPPEAMVYKIGDTGPAGGLIFYVDTENSYPDFDYLEAAPEDHPRGTYVGWYNGDFRVTGATDTAIGSGKENTDKIIATYGSGEYAASLCADYVLGDFSDWYLPSKDEANLLYHNLYKNNLGAMVNQGYATSTESGSDVFWIHNFFTGMQLNTAAKSYSFRVRPIRRF